MIKAKYNLEANKITAIEITGHAEYANSGKDIVCAAVSTAIIVTINAIEMLNVNSNKNELIIEEGYFKFIINEENMLVDKLILNLEYTLQDLEKQYPKYIKNQKEG